MICLQHHKSKAFRKRMLIKNLDDLPQPMKNVYSIVFLIQKIFLMTLMGWDRNKTKGSWRIHMLNIPIQESLTTDYLSRLHLMNKLERWKKVLAPKFTKWSGFFLHAGLTKSKTAPIEYLLSGRYRFSPVAMIEPPVIKLNELLKPWKE